MKKLITTILLVLTLTTTTGAYVAFALPFYPPDVPPTTDSPAPTTDTEPEMGPPAPLPAASSSTSPAATTTTPTTTGTSTTGSAQELGNISMILVVQKFANELFWPIMMLSGGLLDNSLILNGGMGEQLREIWVPIRNIVNILFVLALVGVALYNVLGIGDENATYSLKAIIPKVIIALIAINFSFGALTIVLEGIETLTTAVFSLPRQISDGYGVLDPKSDADKIQRFCAISMEQDLSNLSNVDTATVKGETEFKTYSIVASRKAYLGARGITSDMQTSADIQRKIDTLSPDQQTAFSNDIAVYEQRLICNSDKTLSTYGQQFFKNFTSKNAALAMAINMGHIVYYKDVPLEGIKSLEKLTINTIFSIVFYLVYIVTFLILFLVLLGRVVVIWLGMALSPILMVLLVASDLTSQLSSSLGDLSKKFLDHALAPVKIAVVMSIGWVMLNAIQGFNSSALDSTIGANTIVGFPVVGLSSLQDIIVALGTIAVVWMGIKSVSSELITNVITEKITGFAEDAAKWAGSLPFKHAPLIPIMIPNENGEMVAKDYSLPAIATAAEQAFQKRPDFSLADELFGKSKTRSDAWDDIKTQPELLNHLGNFKGRPSDLIKNDQINSMRRWRDRMRSDGNYNQVEEKLREKIDILLDKSPDEETKTTAAEELLKDPRIIKGGGGPKNSEPTAPTLPEAIKSNDNANITVALNSEINDIIKATPSADEAAIQAALKTKTGLNDVEFTKFQTDHKAEIDAAIAAAQAANPATP